MKFIRNLHIQHLFSGSVILLLTLGCAHQSGPTAAEKAIDRAMAQENIVESIRRVPEAVSAALLAPSLQKQSSQKQRQKSSLRDIRTERFDVAVKEMSAKDFFFGLISETGLNIVVQPDVTGIISLDLTGVTIEEVLEVVRDVYGYEFKLRNRIYTVYPRELRTQIFNVDYLDVKRIGVSDTSVQMGKIEGRSSQSNRNQGGAGSSENQGSLLGLLEDNKKGSNLGTSPGTRILTLNKTDFWSDIHRAVIAIIGGEQGDRMVLVMPQAGMVVVRALPNELNTVRDFLEKAESSVRRQVILEAKILEVRLNERFESGINWSAIGGQIMQFENVSTFESPNTITDKLNNGGLFSSIISVQNISTLLKLLETQGSVQVLSSPRIATVNNQKAVIRVGSDEFFVTGITNNTTSSSVATTSSPTIELDSFFSGIALDVTPQIAANGDVLLHIHPVITDVIDQRKELVLGNETFLLPMALRNIRETDTIVLVKNGQVVVLGGLMLESVSETDGKRPILGDIPLLKSLFKTRERRKSKTELVILLQAIVIDDDAWRNSVHRSRDRIRSLGDEYRELFRRKAISGQ